MLLKRQYKGEVHPSTMVSEKNMHFHERNITSAIHTQSVAEVFYTIAEMNSLYSNINSQNQ